jgi:hypothetical protein
MSIFKGKKQSEITLSSTFNVTIAAIQRNLITDWQYKSDLVVQLLWTLTNLVAFGVLGLAVGTGSGDFAPPYSMALFLLSSSSFWTLYTGNYEDTSFCLREEAARGTMGYLVTNNVDPLGIMVGRYISSSVKFFFIFLITTIPIFALVKNDTLATPMNLLPHTAKEFFMLVPLFLLAYVFMLSVSVLIGSISLLVKKNQTIVKIMLYLVRIIAGNFFPIKFYTQYGTWVAQLVISMPIASGQYAMRKYLIEHNTAAGFFGFNYGQILLINLGFAFGFLAIVYFTTKWITGIARKRGTIEFY